MPVAFMTSRTLKPVSGLWAKRSRIFITVYQRETLIEDLDCPIKSGNDSVSLMPLTHHNPSSPGLTGGSSIFIR